MSHHRLRTCVLLLLLLLVPTAAAHADGEARGVRLIGAHDKHLARFETVTYTRHKNRFYARSTSTNGAWVLKVDIKPWHGYGADYEVDFDSPANNVFVWRKDDPGLYYSNVVTPPAPSPGFGMVLFREHGGLMGVGFGPAMYQVTDTGKAVTLSGVMRRVRRR